MTSKKTVSTLKDMYSSMTDDCVHRESQMNSDNEKLQRERQQLKQKLKEAEDRETHTVKQLKKDLSRREKTLASKERGTAKKGQDVQPTGKEHMLHLTSPLLSEEKWRSLHEREGELKIKAEDSQDNGKPARRNSYQLDPPKMTGSEHGPLDIL